jgi:hypothetical protein
MHQRDRHHQAGDEAAARQVVAAQEDVTPPPSAPAAASTGSPPPASADAVARVLVMRPSPAAVSAAPARRQQRLGQRKDHQRGDAQHGDLAKGIIAAEVDDDGVDHIGAARPRLRLRPVKARPAERRNRASSAPRPARHRPGRPPPPARRRAACAGGPGFRRGVFGQEVQRQQHQDHGHHLDRDLRQRQIGGRQPGKAEPTPSARSTPVSTSASTRVAVQRARVAAVASISTAQPMPRRG